MPTRAQSAGRDLLVKARVQLHLFLAMGKSKKRSNEAADESDKARAKQRREELS